MNDEKYMEYVKWKSKYKKLLKYIKEKKEKQIGGVIYKQGDIIKVKEKGKGKEDYFETKIINATYVGNDSYRLYEVKNKDGEVIRIDEKRILGKVDQNSNRVKLVPIENVRNSEEYKEKAEKKEKQKELENKAKYKINSYVKFFDMGHEKIGQIRSVRLNQTGNIEYKIKGSRDSIHYFEEEDIDNIATEREYRKYLAKPVYTNTIIKCHYFTFKNYNNEQQQSIDIKKRRKKNKDTIENKYESIFYFEYSNEDNNCNTIMGCEVLDNEKSGEKAREAVFKNCLIKFNLNQQNLSFEQEKAISEYIIHYVISQEENIKNNIENYVVLLEESETMTYYDFKYLIEYFSEKQDSYSGILNDYYRKCLSSNEEDDLRKPVEALLFPYMSYKLINEENTLFDSYNTTKTIFNILYCIYILHQQLDIMHFNCSFNNFVFNVNGENKTKTILFEDKEYSFDFDYNIKITNFEDAVKIKRTTESAEIPNKKIEDDYTLCQYEGKCNKYSQKDIFIIVSCLLAYLVKTDPDNTELYNIILIITNYNYGLISAIIKKNGFSKEDNFFSSFCKFNSEVLIKSGDLEFKTEDCSETDYPDLDIIKVLNRYIDKYGKEMNLVENDKNESKKDVEIDEIQIEDVREGVKGNKKSKLSNKTYIKVSCE
jgi:hypothetical protein